MKYRINFTKGKSAHVTSVIVSIGSSNVRVVASRGRFIEGVSVRASKQTIDRVGIEGITSALTEVGVLPEVGHCSCSLCDRGYDCGNWYPYRRVVKRIKRGLSVLTLYQRNI